MDSYTTFTRIILHILLILILSNNICLGQNDRINFQSINYGLSNPHVKCIYKDYKGFMWFGTSEGLNKYDGTKFTMYAYNPNDSSSLVNNNINALLEDKNHNLWIGTTIGVCIYNREKDNFSVLKGIGRNRFSYISCLFEDKNGNIWIGSSGQGIYVYNPKNDSLFTYTHNDKDPASVSTNYISNIISGKNNEIWLATNFGLDLFTIETGRFIHFKSNNKLATELQSSHVKRICFDHENNLWAGTYGNGLYKIVDKGNDWQIQHFQGSDLPGNLSSNDILSLICDNKGNLWIGTENGGLNALPVNSNKFKVYKTEDGNLQGISSNSIWALYQDSIGILWIGTYNQGLNFIDENIEKFEVFQRNPFNSKTLVNNNVVGFAEDNKRNLWIATDGGGISSYDLTTRKFTNKIDNSLLSSKAVIDVLCDSKQRIWAATWGGGIEVYDNSGKKIKNFELEAFNRPGSIFCLMEDNEGNIWAGTARNGLLVYDSIHNSFNKIIDSSAKTQLADDAFVMALFQDSENTIWVGVSFSLISIRTINGERVYKAYQHTTDPQSLSSFNIATIFEDSKNNIWIGTDDGLNLLDKENGTFTIYRKENGLPNNTINGIVEDEKYCLWLSTYGGISKFDIEKETFKNYSVDDGLLSNSFNPRACLKTQTGEFFFGNNSGFISFFPDSIKPNTYIPPVYFTGFKTFNTPAVIGAEGSPLKKNISETKRITLNHKQTSFMIEFVALNYTHPIQNQYAYMLEGFDKEWIKTDKEQYATYTNIDAGKYTFKVMGSNNEGIWNPDPIELEITVLPPFWKTKLAYLLYITCFILILWGFIKLLIIRSHQAEKLRLEKIHHEKSEELNRMKIRFFANVSHEFRTPLSLILAPLQEILNQESLKNTIKTRVETIFRNANKLFGLVNELMDFTKSGEGQLKMKVQKVDLIQFTDEVHKMFIAEARRRNINYRCESVLDKLDAWVDKGKMEKIISNLLSNAFKFTQDNGNIVLGIDQKTENGRAYATISITDNGRGISQQYIDKIFDRFYQSPDEENNNITGTGIGLALVKSLVELHHGTIGVTSQKWKETCFTLKIPLGNELFDKNELLDESGEYFVSYSNTITEENNGDAIKSKTHSPLLLIVEDNVELREYLASILSPKYQIHQAADGMEALQIARDSIPDLILSDIAMPNLSGTKLCHTIKNEMPTSHIPVILLTSMASTSDVIEGVETGADAYITKPFDVQHLIVTIDKTIDTRRKLYQRFSQDIYLVPNESFSNDLDKKFLEKIIEYIDKNSSNRSITVENLATHLLMSRTNVYRKIKAITGQTATEFIRSTLLKKAIKLLENGQYNITEIAFNVGFSTPGYFSKCFKEQYGKSPSEYLNNTYKV